MKEVKGTHKSFCDEEGEKNTHAGSKCRACKPIFSDRFLSNSVGGAKRSSNETAARKRSALVRLLKKKKNGAGRFRLTQQHEQPTLLPYYISLNGFSCVA